MFVSDADSLRIVDADTNVLTLRLATSPGYVDGQVSNALFGVIRRMVADSNGDVFFVGSGGALRKIRSQDYWVSTVSDAGSNAEKDGTSDVARFGAFADIEIAPDDSIYIADQINHSIRRIVFDAQEEPVDPASLSLSTYSGLSVTGLVGRTYRIESSTSASGEWSTVETIRLPESPHLWIDRRGLTEKQFYRAVLLP